MRESRQVACNCANRPLPALSASGVPSSTIRAGSMTKHPIGNGHSRQSMRDDPGGAIIQQRLQTLQHEAFAGDIQ
jgi:hypothetical protein